jgi:hypothetical protein
MHVSFISSMKILRWIAEGATGIAIAILLLPVLFIGLFLGFLGVGILGLLLSPLLMILGKFTSLSLASSREGAGQSVTA